MTLLAEVLAPPTAEAWAFAVLCGFTCDGCSFSPDEFVFSGVPIANGDLTYPPLPCDGHDFEYFVGGDDLAFALANARLFVRMVARIEHVPERLKGAAYLQCKAYFDAVSGAAGKHAWDGHKKPHLGRWWG